MVDRVCFVVVQRHHQRRNLRGPTHSLGVGRLQIGDDPVHMQ